MLCWVYPIWLTYPELALVDNFVEFLVWMLSEATLYRDAYFFSAEFLVTYKQ